ncbi:T9SS type A sorting domain-containing protein [Brumimicrobium oceani]|uniref:Secretion system C-terminal sorting domain-containing protein n=1 Tax=Brumimicrobium oceani TaxID=2100725 RepID=A0A2U2XE44_9FLAO|nr:T9SS type A sorting domain-containing protein [Brumimicrobium oceani]PWH86055.1 hypothetical protein DIT68_05730 [Brumimicrobium oceani]
MIVIFGRKQLIQSDSILDDIYLNISEYQILNTQQEMLDFYTFKKYILSITDSSGIVKGLNDQQVFDLINFSEELTGRARVQAQNLLCFFEGLCESPVVIFDSESKSMQQNFSPKTEMIFESLDDVRIIPNPNRGAFIVELSEHSEIKTLEVFSIDGKILNFKSEKLSNSSSRIQVETPVKGLYWLIVNTVKGINYSTKFVIK